MMHRYKGGRGWEYDCDGRIVLERETKPARTRGEPVTMRTMLDEFGGELRESSALLRVDLASVMTIVALESVPVRRGSPSRDPRSYRWEPKPKDYSAGLMQTMSRTAEAMRKKYSLDVPEISETALYVPRTSILCGVAYLRHQADRYKTDDIMLLQAAYNAGGLYTTKKNEWNLRTHSPDRTARAAAWYNAALTVLGEGGL